MANEANQQPQEPTIEELKIQLTAETKRADEAEALVVELNARISKAESVGVKVLPNVKLGKDHYSFVSEPGIVPPFGELMAESIADDSEELAHLVKIKATCLVKIDTKKA
ncbi:hypothetical protein [Siphonobacter sp.]|uniref:hypothetical protein n=1 Tax=Siphonobacter sp. TaxID=1869184 RepID=UPI003B3A48BF